MNPIQDPVLKRIYLIVGIALFVWLIYALIPVIVPFLLALVLAYLLNPMIVMLKKRGFARGTSIMLVLVALIFALVLALSWLIPLIFEQIRYAQQNWPEFLNWINVSLLPWLNQKLGMNIPLVDLDSLSNSVIEYLQSNYNSDGTGNLINWLTQSGLSLANIAGLTVLVPIVACYFLVDWEQMLVRLSGLIPRRHEASFTLLMKDCHSVLSAFIKGQLTVMVCLGLIYAVGLELVGLDLGLIIGMVAGLSSIIPYVGFAVGLTAAIVAGLFQMGFDPLSLALILGVFVFGQMMEGYVLQPKLLGDRIGLNPVVVIFSVLAGAKLMGLGGMLIALPVAAVLKVLLGRLYELYLSSHWYLDRTESESTQSPEAVDAANPIQSQPDSNQEPPWLQKLGNQGDET